MRKLELQCAIRWTLEILLHDADDEGYCWAKPESIAAVMPRSAIVPRYSVHSAQRGLRVLRSLGLLTWVRIWPGECYPSRNGKPGKKTFSGGRVYQVNLPVLRGDDEAALADLIEALRQGRAPCTAGFDQVVLRPTTIRRGPRAGKVEGPPAARTAREVFEAAKNRDITEDRSITLDRSRSISSDRSSDLGSPNLNDDRARPAGAPARPTAAQVASETPSALGAANGQSAPSAPPSAPAAATPRPQAPMPPPPPHAPPARPAAAQVASQTPSSAPVARSVPAPSPSAPTPRENGRARREGEQDGCHAADAQAPTASASAPRIPEQCPVGLRPPEERTAFAAEREREMAWLYTGGAPPPPAPPRERDRPVSIIGDGRRIDQARRLEQSTKRKPPGDDER